MSYDQQLADEVTRLREVAADRDQLRFDLHHQKEVYAGAVLTVERLTAERDALKMELSCAYPAASMPKEYRKLRAENERLRAELAEALQANELYCEDQNEKAEEIERLLAELGQVHGWRAEDRADNLRLKQLGMDGVDREEALKAECEDLREAAKDCSGEDHQPYCRHYKRLKADNERLRAECERLKEKAQMGDRYIQKMTPDMRKQADAFNAKLGQTGEMLGAEGPEQSVAVAESGSTLGETRAQLTELCEAAQAHCAMVVHHAPEHEEGIRNRLLDSRSKLRAALAKVKPMAALEQTIEAKIARGEANYWDTFDAEGKVKR